MSITEIIKTSLKNIRQSKLRTFLTMIGIIIGIGSVILVTSAGDGMKRSIQQDLNKMGMNVLDVKVNLNNNTGVTLNQTIQMTTIDKKNLEQVYGVKAVTPILSYGYTQLKNTENTNNFNYANFQGVDPDFFDIQSSTLMYGRFFNKYDEKFNNIIIDNMLSKKIFGTENSVGKLLTVNLQENATLATFMVIGVIENPYAGISTIMHTTTSFYSYIPYKKMQEFKPSNYIDSYNVKVDKNVDEANTANLIATVLATIHHSEVKHYTVQPTATDSTQFVSMIDKVTAFVSLVAGISLVVGGIGVMNIMLVTVTERTREIGIRKAIGAKNSDILFQFLIESVVMTVFGGILGILCGYGSSFLLSGLTHATPVLNMSVVVIAVGTSMLIGIIFGVYPARKASKLNPIEALRYE